MVKTCGSTVASNHGANCRESNLSLCPVLIVGIRVPWRVFGYSENTDLLSLDFLYKEKAKGDDEDAERRRVKDALRSAEIGAEAIG